VAVPARGIAANSGALLSEPELDRGPEESEFAGSRSFLSLDKFSHNLACCGIAHSGFLRRAASRLENMFYGRKPAARLAPD
jgi:hypothetical protein